MKEKTLTDVGRTLKQLAETWHSEESRAARAEELLLLARRGWFVTLYDMPAYSPKKLADLITRGESHVTDQALTHYFEDAMPRLMKHLEKGFSARRKLIEKAYMAHRLALYDFSVPVFLAQADGIGNDIFGFSPYSRHQHKLAKLERQVNAEFDTETAGGNYWQLIYSLLPIHASERDIEIFEDPLNRHEVLHGLRFDYGTQMNSCKAFSWLQYVASFADDCWLWKKEKPEAFGDTEE